MIEEINWLIASDIHGSAYYCEKLLKRYRQSGADRLLLLGDLLYHGPRNDLPKGYEPKSVIEMLNSLSDSIFAVRGNCEAEVDQLVLDFPCMSDSLIVPLGKRCIFATHGHIFSRDDPPPFHRGDILLHGHTHISCCDDCGDFFCCNPGSVSIPKNGTANGYMMLNSRGFEWFDIDGHSLGVTLDI